MAFGGPIPLSKNIAKESERSQKEMEESQEKLSELEKKTKDYSELKQKAQKDKTFETVRELFNDDEARVYRQGNSLVISLKKINFGVNKSEIPSPSFDLLKKVQTAINSFSEPTVVVEGHTDSTGDATLNQTLSEKRAEAVKEYFLSNNLMPPERVVAVGLGSEKPLASNKSSEGRAVNRRIDIVIKE
jgi:OOP family OmpA-OmpF porin